MCSHFDFVRSTHHIAGIMFTLSLKLSPPALSLELCLTVPSELCTQTLPLELCSQSLELWPRAMLLELDPHTVTWNIYARNIFLEDKVHLLVHLLILVSSRVEISFHLPHIEVEVVFLSPFRANHWKTPQDTTSNFRILSKSLFTVFLHFVSTECELLKAS